MISGVSTLVVVLMWHYTELLDQIRLIHHQTEDIGHHQEYHSDGQEVDHQVKGQEEDRLAEDHQVAEDHQEDPHFLCHKHHNQEDTMAINW
jgi:hypothetical protein